MAPAPDRHTKAIGRRIAQARKETGGMTQVELAALLGVSERSAQAYETGEVVPYRQMRDLERILNKPTAWFLYGDAAFKARDKQFETLTRELTELRREVRELSQASLRAQHATTPLPQTTTLTRKGTDAEILANPEPRNGNGRMYQLGLDAHAVGALVYWAKTHQQRTLRHEPWDLTASSIIEFWEKTVKPDSNDAIRAALEKELGPLLDGDGRSA